MKLRIDYRSIKFKTWLYFILFTGFLMIVLWFLQVLFLNNFYEVMKVSQTEKVVKNIKTSYVSSSYKDFIKKTEKISDSNDIYIYISSFDGDTMYFKPSGDNTSSRYYLEQINTVNQRLFSEQKTYITLRIKGQDDSKITLACGIILTGKDKTPLIVYVFLSLIHI